MQKYIIKKEKKTSVKIADGVFLDMAKIRSAYKKGILVGGAEGEGKTCPVSESENDRLYKVLSCVLPHLTVKQTKIAACSAPVFKNAVKGTADKTTNFITFVSKLFANLIFIFTGESSLPAGYTMNLVINEETYVNGPPGVLRYVGIQNDQNLWKIFIMKKVPESTAVYIDESPTIEGALQNLCTYVNVEYMIRQFSGDGEFNSSSISILKNDLDVSLYYNFKGISSTYPKLIRFGKKMFKAILDKDFAIIKTQSTIQYICFTNNGEKNGEKAYTEKFINSAPAPALSPAEAAERSQRVQEGYNDVLKLLTRDNITFIQKEISAILNAAGITLTDSQKNKMVNFIMRKVISTNENYITFDFNIDKELREKLIIQNINKFVVIPIVKYFIVTLQKNDTSKIMSNPQILNYNKIMELINLFIIPDAIENLNIQSTITEIKTKMIEYNANILTNSTPEVIFKEIYPTQQTQQTQQSAGKQRKKRVSGKKK